tara:strand:- start:6282 stop:6482 length:201 start_codon:yes stop_codon:yes gene_type:complete
MKTFITDNENLKAMTKAIRKAGFTLESERTTHLLKTPSGEVLFRAMRGTKRVNSTWLVSHHEKLFI